MSPKKPLTLSTAKRKSRISAKLAKKSEIAAKKLDKDVAKLKAKEFRESEVKNSATPDIVATQSWRLATHATTQLANTEQSTEQKSNSQSTTADIDNRHSTVQTASTDPEKTLLEQQQQANAAETLPKFQDYGSSESTHLGQGPHFDDTQPPLVTLSQLPEIRDIKQQIEPTALTVSMARTTLTQSVRPPIISTEQHHTPLSIDEQVTHQSIKEDAPAASISGKLNAHGEAITSLQWTVAEHQGQFGRLDIDPITGEWHYQLDNNAPNTDALAEGEHQTEQFTVTVSGLNGEQVSTLIIIDVEGSNDLPQILGSHLASINAADSLQTVMGQLRSVDPDHNDVITWAVLDGQGQYGQLSINPLTGQWQYQLNNHANATLALFSGQQVTETFTVTATDQSGHPVSQQVSIQINGADDAAIIQGEMTGLVTEDTQTINGQLTVSGQLSIQDPDKDQAHFSADSLQGQFGYLTIDVNGHWIYNADNTQATIQSLRSGEHLTDTFIIHSADGTAQNITVTINGTDDKAEISGTTSASLTEDSDTYQGMLRANGNLTITDNDHGPHLFTATEQSGQFGTLTIDELGHWTYIADNSQTAIQALKTGESITDTLVVQTQDGTQQTISITINGTDDHSVIRGTSVVRVFEDKRLSQGRLHTDGQLWVSNPDTGRAGFAAEQRQGQFGLLSINSDGHWTYIADNNNPSIQALKHGEFVTETLFVKALDGTSQKIEILIKGADDKAIIGGTDTATLIEDQSVQHGQLQAHGTLTITDPDAGQAQFTALTDIAGSAGYGHFSIDATGNWTYTANNTLTAIQQLNTGEHLTDSLTISSADGTNHTLTVTITGSNDAPVVTHSLVTTTATEDTAFSFSIPAGTFADIDTGDTLIFSTGSLPAWLHFDAATGTFSGTPTNGDVGTSQVTITATDGSGAQVSTIFVLNVGNTNDAPTLTHIATVNATEDGAQVTGQFTATDPDSGDTLTFSIAQPVDGLTVNTDGSWRFDPSHASYQHLAAGQTLTLTMPVTVTDAAGATSIQDLVIKLNGSNDGATIGGVSTGSAKEDNAQITTGQLIVADVDDGEAHFVAQTDTAGTYGHFSLSADGRWSYQLDNSKPEIQQLSEGVMLHENFNVHSADGTTHTIIVDIVGTNDAPVLTAQSQSVTEDGSLLSGQMVATDVDTGDTLTFSLANAVDGFTLNADGSYSFDPSNAAYQHLAAGQTQTLTIPVSVTDSTGATSTANLTITLTGSNDGAIISGTDASAVTEDTQLTTQGQLTVTDIDDQESAFTAQANTAGSYGSFTLAADGHWTYTLDNKNSAVQALGQNGTLTDSLTAQSVDGTTHTVTVTINGHDDGAVIAGVDSGAVTEDANLTAGQLETRGQLTITDPDAGQDHFTAQPHVAGSYGTFSLDADGQWHYSADNSQSAVQQLKAGETLTDSLTVQSVGGTTHTVTITLTGSNDAPVLTAQSQSVTEDGTKLSGQMVATDMDTGDSQSFSTSAQTAGFTLNADGSYSFAPANAAYQHLAAGQTETLTIPITVTDSTGATSTANLTITLTGSNDGAIISGTDASAVTEDTQLTTQGQLTVTDIDDQESAFTAQANTAGSYGSFTLAADGHWTYTLDNKNSAVQALGQNGTLTDSLTAQSVDGTTHTVTVTINGHDDGAVIAGVDSGAVTEDANLTAGQLETRGQLTITDPDAGQDHFTAQPHVAGSYGTFSLDADGQWHYSADNSQSAVQQLKAGETLTDSLTVQSVGGTTHTVTITLTGSNDAPVLTAQSQSVSEDGTQLSGQMVATDMDTGDSQTFSTSAQTAGFTLNADGSYSFDPSNAAYQHLPAGQTETLSIPITVTDNAGATSTANLTITLTGSNDGAIISGTDASAVTEDTQLTTQGQLTVTDIDDQESAFTAQANTAGNYGSFTLAADGHWTYTLDNNNSAVQALGQNATLTDSLTVQSVDGTTHTITVTINGHDDGAVIAGVDSGAVTEDANLTAGQLETRGQLTITDPDAGQDHFTAQPHVAGSYGTFSLDADGQWHYSADNSQSAVQQLKAGETLTDSLTVQSVGGTTHTVTITLTGSNDAPVLTAQSQSVTEDGTQLSGQMVATDVDTGDSQSFSTSAQTAGFTLNADGSYSFAPANAAYQHLAAGQTETLTIPITVTDSTGATSTANLTITLTGSNDGAIISGTDAGTVTEDTQLTTGGQLTVTDIDDQESAFTAQAKTAGSYGSFTLAADGHWTYTLNNSLPAVQALGQNGTLTDSLTVQSVDGTTHTVTITLTGSNDAPVLTAQSQSVSEDGTQLSGQMVATDMDTGDSQTFSTSAQTAGFTLNADGSYSFDPSNAAYQHLPAGQTETLSIPITVTDNAGATSTANLTITLTGSNDGAIISGTDASAVTEDTQLTTGGQLTVTDIDDQESAFTAQAKTAGSYGSFTLAADGHWTYTLNNSLPAVQALGQNGTLTDSLTVQSVDGTTHTITVTINGHDDGAVIAGVDSGTVTEDANLTAGQLETRGQLTITDPDAGQDHFTAQPHVAGSYGTFSLDADGQWHYSADNSQSAVQQLKAGETLTDSLTVQSVGGTTHTVTITLTGSNDAPVLTAQSQSVSEDGTQLSGQMVATDMDTGDSQTFSTSAQTAGFTLNADGSYSFDPSNAAYQHLPAGQTETLSIPITVTDNAGATSTANLTITLTGSNDGAIISGTDASAVTEDTQLTTQGQLTVTDIDDQESAFTAQANTAGNYGSFTLAADGHWTYTLDNNNSAVQALGQNATLTDSLTVQSVDGTTHTITVTINGHDDGAVIAGVDSGAVTEDSNVTTGKITTSGQLTISDPDVGQDHFTAQPHVAGSYGTFSLDADGQWHYSADNSQTAIQQLKAGETLTDSLTVQSVGGTTHTVTVTITGSNDAPALTAQSQSVTEDGNKLSGQMVATDVDQGDTLHFSIGTRVAGFTMNADGSYNFDPSNAAYQHLAAGQTQTLAIPVTVTDSAGASSTANLTITLTDSNDGALISGTDAGTVSEDTQLTTGGQLTVTDIDDQESAFTAQANTAGSYGSFTLAADGHWTYTLDNKNSAVQALGQNATLTDSLTVQSVDGTTHTVTVTINGHDDGAVIAGVDSGTVTEDANLTAGQLETHGQLTISDPDAGQNHFTAQPHVAGSYGTFSIDADGQWHYSADNSQTAIQQLKAGETLTDSLNIQSVGGTTHTVTVTIAGSNDAPVLIAQSQSVTEDGTKLSGQMVATDMDTGDTLTFSLANAVDGFTLNADGSYSFDPSNAAYQHLAAGQTQTLTIPVSVTDSTGATSTANLTITLTGSNDGAIISGTDASAVTEDTQLTTQGQLTVTDIDDQESAFTAQANTAGSYGSFTLAADGHWTYTLDNKNSAVQALGQNGTLTDSLTAQSVDGTTHTVTVTINGHDDGAVIAGVDSGAVTEDANLTAGQLETRGQLTITDPDAGQDHFTAQPHVAGSYGTFSLDADGQWHYSADNSQSAVQQLKAGETLTDSLTVQSVGGTTHTVTITLTGSNDAPVLTAQSQSVTEDGTKLSGQMVATDMDTGDSQSFSTSAQTAGFTLNADGSYSFAPANAAYQHLAAGQTETLTIPITVTDSTGATSTANLTITLTGSNDGAIISGTDASAVTEDTQLTTQGQLTVTDIDDQESAFTAQANTAGSYGSFTLAADGHWTYTLDNKNSAVQALGQNGTLTDSLTAQSVDGTTHTVTVTINGHDDGAVIAGVDSGAVTEDANLTAGQLETRGQLTITDPDAGQDHFTAQPHVAGSYGTFSLDADGQWHYSADNSQSAVQQLKAGETLTDSLTVQSVGGTTHTVTVTITGSNDAPALTAQSQSVTEDGTKLSGQMVATDMDTGDSQTFSTSAQTAGFTLNADGSYSFDPSNAAYQHLAAGQTQTLTIPVSVTDSAGATSTANLTITLTGSNDGALISGTDTGAVTEDTQLTTQGQLTVTDIDDQESAFTAQANTAGSYGSFTLAADGHWTYTLDNSLPAVQALGQNATLTDSLTVQSVDGTTHEVTVTINGHDDGAVIEGVDSGAVTEDSNVKISGLISFSSTLTVSDIDTGEARFPLQQGAGSLGLGNFLLAPTGGWGYSVDNNLPEIQQLKAGQTLVETYTFHSADGSQHTVTVTITGSNDAPVLTAQSQSVSEDGTQLSGQMVATDVDTGDSQSFSTSAQTAGFTLNADGSYSFAPANAAYQHLAAGQTETLTIPITVTDSTGATSTANLTITLTGSNDGAIISGTDAGTVTEDTQLTTGGQLTVTDIDDQESAFTAQAKTAGSYGSFTLAADGHWTYTLNNSLPAVQALGQNGTLTDSLTVQSVDGTTHTITVTINGHDDGAVIAGVDSGTVTEDANLTAGQLETRGQLTITDPDAGQDHFTAQPHVAGSYGSFSLDADGQWHYSADNSQTAIQQLKAGETLTDSLTVQSVGGTTHTVTITLTGSNDAPVLTAQSQSVSEDGTQLSGQMVATDMDTGDSQTFSTSAQTAGFTLNADGSYSFDPSNAAYQHLPAGQTETLSIPITVTDNAGATSTANLTITLTGSNDGAIISGTDASAVTEDTQLTTQGQLTVTDIDDQESAFTAQANTAGNYGSFTLAADGHWTYTLDNNNSAVQALGQNATLTDSLTVQSVDGTTHTITVTINGHDDGAVIAGVDSGAVTEDSNVTTGKITTSGQLTISDPDVGQDHFTAQPHVAGSYGTFSLDADGQWHYSADNSQSAVQQLKAGETLTDSLTVQSVGGTTHTVTVTLTGTNDAPTVTAGTDMGSIGDACSQTYTQTQLLALVHASDVDHDTTLSISSVSIDAQYGTFSRHGDNWVFTPITGVTGDKVPVTITVSDGTTTSNAQSTLTIEAHGVLAINSIDNSLAVQTTAGGIHHVHGANHPGQSGHWSGNAYEVTTGDITAHGSAVRVHDGSTVTVHLVDKLNPANTFDLTTTVTGGLWTVTVPHSQIDKVGNHEWAVDVTTTDRYGTTLHTTTEIIDEGSLSKAVTEGGTIATLDLLDGADGMTVQNLMYSTDGKHFSSTVPGGFIFSQDSHSLQIDPTHPDYDRLAAGATHTIYLKYDISETVGSATQTVHQTALITFNGTNDAPVISAVTGTSGSITEDSATTTTSGTLTASDVDAGSHLAWSIANTVGTYGSVAIDADSGQWTYTIDNHRAATQGLAGGQSGSETFTITVTDEHGATATQTLTIAVAGTNDGAVISGVDSGTTTEDASQVVSGQLTVSDTDNGEAHFNAQIDTAGIYGSFNLDTDGLWAYQLDNNKPEVQALKTGQHVTDTFTVTSADGTTHQVIVTIAGKDDGAMIGGADQGTVTEDLSVKKGQLQTSGQLSISDPDLGQAHFTVQPNTAGTYGHFSLSEDGQWSYRADNHQSAIQQLKAGATLTDSFTVTSADGTNHTVTVTLTGSNDAPVLTAQSQSVSEDGAQLSGQMVATDVDIGDTLTFSLANAVDGFTLNADGSYSFDPSHASYQHLSQGQTETLTIPVTVTDSAGASSTQNLTITLTGTNDSAKINDHGTPGQIKEDQHTAIEGNLSVSDTDSGESVFSNQEGSSLNGYGNFILTPQANGQAYWRYTANHTKLAIQQLNEGQILHDSFTVHSADGTTHTITVDIVGTNDAPVLTAQSQSVSEDGTKLSGQMVATDVDTGDTLTFSLANSVDGFTLNADGSYSFDPSNAAYQHLAAGQTETLTIPITVTDSAGATSTANLTITLTGSNDGAVISGTDAGTVTEDTQLTTQGQLTVTDIDDQESAFTAQANTAGSYGCFTLATDGHWTYTLDNKNSAVQALGQNATLTDSLTVQSVDGTTHTITVTINGHDDGAVIAGVDSGTVTEDANLSASQLETHGQLTISDPDAGQDHFTSQTNVAGSYGTFSLDQAGHWTYVSDNSQSAIQQLKAGETLTDSLTVQSVGGTTHTVTVTITGSNDAPVLTTQSQSVSEDGSLLTGQMVATDVDTGDSQTFSTTAQTAGFTLNADGSYSFDPTDAAYQHLAAGQTETLSIPITVTDSAGATSTANLTITLTGSNDGAVISGTDAGTVTEDTQLTTQGQLTVTDIDDQESAFTAQANTAGNYGSFTLAADGHWTYTLDNKNSAVQALGQNGTLTDSLTVQSVDGTTHTITVTINGHDDGAVIAGVDSGAVTEDSNVTTGKITTSGQLTISDPDAGQDHFTAQTNVAGSYGMFSLDADGQWHYSADNSQTAIQQLKAGETLIDSLAVQSVGGTTHTVTITINGHDDGAVIAGVDSGAVTEDANLTAGQLETHGQLIISDPDAGQDHFTAQTNVAGSYGTFSLDADGQWRYSADNSQSAIQQLKTGETLTDSFTVTSADGTNHAVTVTLTGSNDAPVLTAQSQSVSEDGAKLTGQMVVTDVDTGDTLSFSLANGVDGFTLNTDGSYSFDPASAAYQHLAQGQTETLTIPITVTDSTGATSTANLTITLTGTNDGATISGVDTGRVIEDQNVDAQGLLHASGQLQIQDADAGQSNFVAQSGVATQYGHFSIDAQGVWSYTVDNNKPEVQALKPGGTPGETGNMAQALGQALVQSTMEGFHAVGEALTQGQSGALAGVLDLTVQGAAIVLSGPSGTTPVVYAMDAQGRSTLGVDELLSWLHQGAGYEIHLQGSQSDVQFFVHDRGDESVLHGLPLSGSAMLTTPESAAAHLALTWHTPPVPSELSEVVSVTSIDGTTHQITLSIQGTAEDAVITGTDSGRVTEDQNLNAAHQLEASGQLQVTDTDPGQAVFQPIKDLAGHYGNLTMDKDGAWVYHADNNSAAVQALVKGQTVSDSFVVHSFDGTAHTINVTLEGVDETYLDVMAHVTNSLFNQWNPWSAIGSAIASGNIANLNDIELSFGGGTPTVIDANGHVLESFTNKDYFGTHIPLGHLVELLKNHHGAQLILEGAVGTSSSFYVNNTGNPLQLNYAGLVRYNVANNTLGSVPNHSPLTLQATVATGNHAAVLAGADSGSVLADGNTHLQTQGHLTVLDVDGDQAHFTPLQDIKGQYGQFSIDAQGHWHYQADGHQSALQQLTAGKALSDTFTVTSADGTAHTVTVQLFGSNQNTAAIISGADNGKLTEDGTQSQIGGQLSVVDPDTGEAHFIAQADAQGQYGQFSIDEQGTWQYRLDNADPTVQALKAGETLTDLLTVHSADGSSHVLRITVEGSNDAPVMQAQSQSVTEDGGLLRGQMAALDVDRGDVLHFFTAANIPGFVLHDDGSYSFDPSHQEYQSLTNGQVRNIAIPVVVTDSSGARASQFLTLHITGQNDGAVISGDDHASVQVQVNTQATGQLLVSDADLGQDHFQAGQYKGDLDGTLTLDAQGHWQYQLNEQNAFVQHQTDKSYTFESFTVKSADGSSHEIRIEVHGAPSPSPQPQQTAQGNFGAYMAQDIYDALQPAIDGAGYQYRDLAKAFATGDMQPFSNMELSIAGVHIQIVTPSGQLQQTISPTGTDNAAVLSMTQLMQLHSQGYGILVSSDSGLDTARMWLHNTGDPHNIHVEVNGVGFTGWSGPYTFGELQLHAQTSSQSSDEANFETIDSVNLDVAEPATLATSAHDLDSASSGHLNVSSVNYDASLLMGSVDEQTAQTNPAQDKSVDTTLFEGGNFSAQATTSPIDHYLQMVGLMPDSIEQQPTTPIELATLNTPSSTFQDMDTDMLDMVTINHFENPLIEEHKTPHLDQYGFQGEHAQLEVNPNDDDLLHSALNDMHNQM